MSSDSLNPDAIANLASAAAQASGSNPDAIPAAGTAVQLAQDMASGNISSGVANSAIAAAAQASPALGQAMQLSEGLGNQSLPGAAIPSIPDIPAVPALPPIPGMPDMPKVFTHPSHLAVHPMGGYAVNDLATPSRSFPPPRADAKVPKEDHFFGPYNDLNQDNRLLRFYMPQSQSERMVVQHMKGSAGLSTPVGQVKFPHLWPGQTPPGRTVWIVVHGPAVGRISPA